MLTMIEHHFRKYVRHGSMYLDYWNQENSRFASTNLTVYVKVNFLIERIKKYIMCSILAGGEE